MGFAWHWMGDLKFRHHSRLTGCITVMLSCHDAVRYLTSLLMEAQSKIKKNNTESELSKWSPLCVWLHWIQGVSPERPQCLHRFLQLWYLFSGKGEATASLFLAADNFFIYLFNHFLMCPCNKLWKFSFVFRTEGLERSLVRSQFWEW